MGVEDGDTLPSEAELAAVLSMGRQQVREGLCVLEAFGAVAARQGARRVWLGYDPGAMIARAAALVLDGDEAVRELLEVRHALETALLPTVAQRLTKDDLLELSDLSDRMVILAKAGKSFALEDAQFHRRLFAPLSNRVVHGILQTFWSLFDASSPAFPLDEDLAIAAMHGRIVDAIEDGDIRRSVYEMDAHFYGVHHRFPKRQTPNPA